MKVLQKMGGVLEPYEKTKKYVLIMSVKHFENLPCQVS